jgi:hypothetical protein
VDPSALAAHAIATLSPLLLTGAARSAGLKEARQLLQTLQEWWSDEAAAKEVLKAFRQDPASNEPALTAVLEDKLAADPAFRAKLADLLKQIGPEIKTVR